jgi:anti-sigma factor RsiW
MECKLAESLLGDYLDGELSEELHEQVRCHLLSCRSCAWEVESLRETLAALRESAFSIAPAPEFRERLLLRLLQEHQAAVAGGPKLQRGRLTSVLELTNEEVPDVTTESN